MISGGGDELVFVYKMMNYQLKKMFSCDRHTHWIKTIVIYDNFFATGSFDKTFKIWSFDKKHLNSVKT